MSYIFRTADHSPFSGRPLKAHHCEIPRTMATHYLAHGVPTPGLPSTLYDTTELCVLPSFTREAIYPELHPVDQMMDIAPVDASGFRHFAPLELLNKLVDNAAHGREKLEGHSNLTYL